MAKNRIPEEVATAMRLAREADWGVSIRNEKIVISAPDGKAITIGMNPNDESMKVWRSNARSYNLDKGPARTPEEQERLLAQAKAVGDAQAEAANKKRQEYEAEQAAKRAEAEEAAKKAAAATAKGLVSAVTGKSSSSFPEFSEALLGTTDYSKFQLADGRYYCVECLQVGTEFIAKKAQGLAAHRGIRHQMYQGEAPSQPTNAIVEISRVHLPSEVQDAIELLRSVIGEHVSSVDDSARVEELEKLLVEAKEKTEEDSRFIEDLREKLSSAVKKLAESQEKAHGLAKELHGKDGIHQAEVNSLMASVQKLLKEIRDAVNNLSPAQAVGKVDELVSSYLGS